MCRAVGGEGSGVGGLVGWMKLSGWDGDEDGALGEEGRGVAEVHHIGGCWSEG
jgi:hypothetical protein